MPEVFSRRRLLSTSLLAAASIATPRLAFSTNTDMPRLYSARTDQQGKHWCVANDLNGQQVFARQIPNRAHDIVLHPFQQEVLFVGRRPGVECYWLNAESGEIKAVLRAGIQRHFYGHGVFNQDGSKLYLTQNDTSHPGRGVVAIYGYQRGELIFENEFASGGVEPHQLVWLPGRQHQGRPLLAIAHGGMRTNANSRKVLNAESPESSLSIIDIRGQQISQEVLPNPQDSIRHLATSSDGVLVCAQQHKGEDGIESCLLAIKKPGHPLMPFPIQEIQQLSLNQYVASVAIHSELRLLAVTSPRGNRVIVWQLDTGELLLDKYMADCAGIAACDHGFVVSSGQAGYQLLTYQVDGFHQSQLSLPRAGWDNHLRVRL